MKILTVMTSKYTIDGISRVITNNFKYLDKKKYKMDFVFPNLPKENHLKLFTQDGSNIHILPMRNSNLMKYLFELNKIISKNSYDVVHVHGNSTTLFFELFVANINKVPVRIPHSHNTHTEFPIINKVLRPLFDKSYTHGFAVSKLSGKWMFNNEKFYIVENGIDAQEYHFDRKLREAYRDKLNIHYNNKVIGNIGRFNQQKNQMYLIKMLNELIKEDTNYRLLLVGEGQLMDACKAEVKKLQLDDYVIFTGNQAEVAPYLMAMDALVVPSLYEGLGITIIEAQASDLKCFVSNTVPKDSNVTGTVEYFSIEKYDEVISLLNQYFMLPNNRNNYQQFNSVKNSSYNIINSVKKVEKLYDSFL